MTLKQVREHEGRSRRLERLREVFESIPDPPPPAPSPSLPSSTSTAVDSTKSSTTTTTLSTPSLVDYEEPVSTQKETLEEERKRWESERKIYMKELWNKCGAENSASTTSNTTLSTSQLASSTSTTTKPPTSPTASSSCLRWSSFESYADAQERLLYSIFSELDSDNNLKLTPQEVEMACKKAGVEGVDKSLIEGFVKVLDKDGDGMIGWEEWRDFLIVRFALRHPFIQKRLMCSFVNFQLLPRKPSVKEIFHYYRSQTRSSRPSMSRLTQDGDGKIISPSLF